MHFLFQPCEYLINIISHGRSPRKCCTVKGRWWWGFYTILELIFPCLTTLAALGLCTASLLPTPRSYSGLNVSFFPLVELFSVVHPSIKKISL